MSREKTLDEALDEMDRWGDELVKEIKDLSPEEFVAYFREVQDRYEAERDRRRKLPRISSPPARKKMRRSG